MGKGGKKRAANKNKAHKRGAAHRRDVPFAGDNQVYALVEKSLGDKRYSLVCSDGISRLGKIRGGVRKNKKNWVTKGTWVLAALRAYQVNKADIIDVLSHEEVKKLDAYGEISLKNLEETHEEESGFYFSDGEGEDIDIDEI